MIESAVVEAMPTCDELVARAQAIVPRLRERALQAENDRRLPQDSVDELRAAGFHRIMQPVRFGGHGLGMDVATEVIRTLATGCGSSGWVASLFIGHNFQISLFSEQAQEEFWGGSPDAFASTGSFAPRSTLEPVEGGYRLSGLWKFSSGSDFADWFVIMKPAANCLDWMLVPRSDVTVLDDWFVSGLKGTGSRDIQLDNVFVPSHRVLSFGEQMTGTTPGAALHGSPFARLPFPLPGVWGIPAALIGMATGMADAVQAALVGKRALFSGEAQVERVANQIKLADAHARINAATLIMRNRLATLKACGEAGAMPEGAEIHASHRDAAFVARMMAETAQSLALAAGATSVYVTSPVQRFLRDIMVGAAHVSLVWEEAAENYGRALWNLPPKSA